MPNTEIWRVITGDREPCEQVTSLECPESRTQERREELHAALAELEAQPLKIGGHMSQFDKVSLFYIAPDARLLVETTVSANGESCRVTGQPMIEIAGELVQLGCIRMTIGALRMLAYLADTRTGLIQEGDYKTADPNTRRIVSDPTKGTEAPRDGEMT